MTTYTDIIPLREAIHRATRRTIRRMWITFAATIMVWGVVIALVN